ncbi:uncharacterized protein LOC119632343 [Glossina fuscipes]|uniref:Uncharacterized protein LOC119632343 n=1 Tax=Glossina fuscipes TaxID=7396 RepID=A0A8U0W7S0_9MUSC|nr:uncharacterized protein LOC119632343 [Glossina fuscipes]KAI9588681.1 hypothetical protein GQX74_004526 [Glossina fuscipes]
MEEVCQSINAGFIKDETCIHYLYEMVTQCLKHIKNQEVDNNIWKYFKRFIFPLKDTSFKTIIIPAGVQSQDLNAKTCVRILSNYVVDYALRAPHYQNEKILGSLLWKAMFSIVGIIILLILLITIKCIHSKLNKANPKSEDDEEIIESAQEPRLLNLQIRTMAALNRSLRMAREELRRLRIIHFVQCEEILAPDGISILVLKVSSQVELLDNHLIGKMRTSGRLYRLQNQHIQYRYQFQTILLNVVLLSLRERMQRMHFLIEFEEDCIYDEFIWTHRSDTVSTVLRKSTLSSPSTSAAVGRRGLPETSALLRRAQPPKRIPKSKNNRPPT